MIGFDSNPLDSRSIECVLSQIRKVLTWTSDQSLDALTFLRDLSLVTAVTENLGSFTGHEQIAAVTGEAGEILDVGLVRNKQGLHLVVNELIG